MISVVCMSSIYSLCLLINYQNKHLSIQKNEENMEKKSLKFQVVRKQAFPLIKKEREKGIK